MHHGAFHGMRVAEYRVCVLDTALAQQIAHIGGAPRAHFLGLMLLAPCASFGLGSPLQRVGRLAGFGRHHRLRIDRHSGQPRTEIVHDLQLEHAGGERQILNGLHVSGAVRAHGGVGAEHQRAHAEFADHLAKEEAV